MDDPLRHRQTKGAETAMVSLQPPRHIPTLPFASFQRAARLRDMSAMPPIAIAVDASQRTDAMSGLMRCSKSTY